MKTKYLIFMFFLGYFANSQNIEINKVDVKSSFSPDDIIYALPKTILNSTISGKEVIYHKRDKEINMSLILTESGIENLKKKKAIDTPRKEFIAESISIKTKAVPDENHIYKINLKRRWNKTNKLSLEIAENGLLTGGSFSSEDLTFKIIASTINAITGMKSTSNDDTDTFYNSMEDATSFYKIVSLTDIKDLPNVSHKEYPIIKGLRETIKTKVDLELIMKQYTDKDQNLDKNFVFNNVYDDNVKALKHKSATLEKLISKVKSKMEKNEEQFAKILNSFMGVTEIKEISLDFDFDFEFNHKTFENTSKYLKIEPNDEDVFDIITVEKEQYDDKKKCFSCFELFLESDNNDFGDDFYKNVNSDSNKAGLAYKIPASYRIIISSHKSKEPTVLSFFAVGDMYGRLSKKTNLNTMKFYPSLGWFKEIAAETKGIASTDIDSLSSSLKNAKGSLTKKSEEEKLQEETDLMTLQLLKIQLEQQLEDAKNGVIKDEE